MSIPESARGAILDVNRLIRFKDEVNVLILYDESAVEILRLNHWWNLEGKRPIGKSPNVEQFHLRIVEDEDDATLLDEYLTRTKTLKYQAETEPDPTLSDVITLLKAEKPAVGENREWLLIVTVEKFKGRYFTA